MIPFFSIQVEEPEDSMATELFIDMLIALPQQEAENPSGEELSYPPPLLPSYPPPSLQALLRIFATGDPSSAGLLGKNCIVRIVYTVTEALTSVQDVLFPGGLDTLKQVRLECIRGLC